MVLYAAMAQPIESVARPPGAWHSLEPPPREVQPLPGDVSPRRYFRVVLDDGITAILANYPEEVRAVCPRFLRTTGLLTAAGVRVPRVLAGDCDEGWMLVEDLGPRTLGEWGRGRPWSEVEGYFERALEILRRVCRLPADEVAALNPTLGREILSRELAQTWEFCLEPRGLVSDPALAADLRAALALGLRLRVQHRGRGRAARDVAVEALDQLQRPLRVHVAHHVEEGVVGRVVRLEKFLHFGQFR